MSKTLPSRDPAPTPDSRDVALPAAGRGRGIRLVCFRVIMALVALLHLVGFGAWQTILTPWLTFADETDHGWERTPELHRLADSGAGLIMVAIAAAAIVLAVKPARMSGLAAWLAALLTLTGGFSWLSALLQGHDDVVSMLVFSAVWVALIALIFALLHPEGREILRGGAQDSVRPGRGVRIALLCVAAAGAVAVAVAIGWRLAGGVFESPLEDDVFSLVYVGVMWALGGFVAGRGRAGWRPLAAILLTSTAYALVAGVTIALT